MKSPVTVVAAEVTVFGEALVVGVGDDHAQLAVDLGRTRREGLRRCAGDVGEPGGTATHARGVRLLPLVAEHGCGQCHRHR